MDEKAKMDKGTKDVEAEYGAAFDAIVAGNEPVAAANNKDAAPSDEKKPEPKEEPKAKQDASPLPDGTDAGNGEDDGEDGDKQPDEQSDLKAGEDPKGLNKALRDTKSWATKLAQENAELKKKLSQFGDGKATAKDVQQAKDALAATQGQMKEKLAKVYEDYPELKDVLDPLASMAENINSRLEDMKKTSDEEKKRSELKAYFENTVEPEVLKVHPDFSSIKTNDEYFSWAEQQSPAMKTAAMYSLDPRDIVMAVTEFKKFKNSPQADEHKKSDEKKRNAVKDNLSSMRGGSSPADGSRKPSSLDEVDKNDYDAAFNMAASRMSKK